MSVDSSTNASVAGQIAGYLRHAWEDFGDSLQLRGRHGESFHAQQAAEKLIMAILTAEGVHFPANRGHSLDARLREMPDECIWKERLRNISFLEAYATTTRYPRPKTGKVNRVSQSNMARVRVAQVELERLIQEAATHISMLTLTSTVMNRREISFPLV